MVHRALLLAFILSLPVSSLAENDPDWIVSRPIQWNEAREKLTREYRKERYGESDPSVKIQPTMIVLHHTAIDDLEGSFAAFDPVLLPRNRKKIRKASRLNVSAHFLIDQDGTTYRLLPDDVMARHVIGLNWTAIGIENVGGRRKPLTDMQEVANVRLIKHLKRKHPPIDTLIAHSDYQSFRSSPRWKERDPKYLTPKKDPAPHFMRRVRRDVRGLSLLAVPAELRASVLANIAAIEPPPAPGELEGLSMRELSIRRNEIYARHGRAFHTPWVKAYFEAQPWYRVDPTFREQDLSPVYKKVVQDISRFERSITPERLRLMRNTVFARHGREFKSPDLVAHFTRQPWYRPDPAYTDARLTEEDKVEIELLQAQEAHLAQVGALDDWAPGRSVPPKKLKNAEIWEMSRLYQRMLEAFRPQEMVAFCQAEDDDFYSNLDPGTCPAKPAAKVEPLPLDRRMIRQVESVLAMALLERRHHDYEPSCDDECETWGEEEAELDAWAKQCLSGCRRTIKARVTEWRSTRAAERRKIELGEHPRGHQLLSNGFWYNLSPAAFA